MASVVINNNSSESLQDEKKIFVGRVKLSKDFNIINYFKKYEDNDKVQPKIIRKSHRYLIIQFSSIAAARNAISDLNGKTIEGLSTRNIKVEGFVRQQANQSDNNTNKRPKLISSKPGLIIINAPNPPPMIAIQRFAVTTSPRKIKAPKVTKIGPVKLSAITSASSVKTSAV